jgi:gliding motility-associated-like protein
VLQNAGIPQLPVLTGFQTPCAGMTLVYSATATGNPPPTSFNWTLPGNHPFTVLTPSSIEVTWLQGTPTGQLCVTANNSCGASPPACIPLSVGDQPILPQLSGPASVCTAGGDYLFTLDTFQMGTQYFWTVPPGAVLTGSGDSVLINFANAVSGQVCVTAQNACDTLMPVCIDVTVVANPTGELSGLSEICLGDSLVLTFTLTGNGPFDVLWSNGAQNFQQNGPGNVYQATVFPTVNTTYTLISVRDNSMPACETQVLDTLQVTVWPLDTTNQTIEICAGESVFLGGAQQNMPGVYRDTLSNINGCDSIIVSTLVVNPIDTTLVALTTCDPAQAGTVTVVLPQANGCDSVVVTTTTLLPSDLTEIFDNSCDLANVGVFTQNLLNQFGCDSTVITTVSFSDSDTTYLTATTCLPAEVGTFEELLVSVTDGCDSLIITTVTLLPSSTTDLTGTTCNFSESGVFVQSLTNEFGCDSIVTTTITFIPLPPTPLTATTCDPNAVGVFSDTLLTADGCDSILVTTVTLLPSSATDISGTSCNLSEVGVFVQNLTNQFGCDSIVTTTIAFVPLPPTPLTGTTCNASEAGVFTDTIVTAAGCDSLLVTTVTFIPLPPTPLTATTCDPNAVGVFMDTLLTADGCDSILVTTVSLLPSSATSLSGTSCNLSEVGVFVQNLTNQFGCDSIVTTTITFVPLPPTPLTATTCDPAAVGVFDEIIVTADGCDSLVVTTVTLLPSNLTELTASDCDPANIGVFTQDLTNQFGCDSTVITTVTLLPSSATAIASTTCVPSEVGVFVYPLVNQFGCDSIVTETVTLLPSSATTVNVGTCEPNEVGSVITVLTNQFGCDSTVTTVTSLLPPASCGMTAILGGSTIPCGITTGTLTLTVTLGEGPFTYTVLLGATPVANGAIAGVGVAETVSGLAAGNYTVNYTSANGFSTSAQATIIQLFPPVLNVSAASNYGGFGVSCPGATDGSVLGSATGGLAPYNFVWSNGAATPQATNLGVGTYTVTVTDANSCTATGSASLSEPAPLEITFSVNNPRCFGNSNGSIIVTAAGGIQPYRYSLNGGAAQTGNVFAGLDAGAYTITAFDQSECETSEIILVNTPLELIVDLGPDINIELGETANLQAIVNVPYDSLASVIWTPLPDPECPECLEHTVFPLISTTYSIEVIDVNGCRDEDKVVVVVDRRKHVYIPNIFSPNDDGDNDIFSIFARPGTVRNIRSLMLFDRWGEQLYLNENFSPNDGTIGWDGIYKGQPMNPGVYVWVVEIEFIDGVVELYKGDVTLMR